MLKEIVKNKRKLIEATTYAEFSCSDYGWQGDSESRYDESNYDEDTLNEIYKTIAEEQNKSIDEITYYDFCDYVADKTSIEEDTFRYTRDTGEVEKGHSFTLE